jgi:predicted MFS family arabinose efflux permease
MLDTTELRLESPAERGAERLPAALWALAGAMLIIRSAEVFYVPIMPLYARMLNVGVPLAVIGLVTSVDRLGAVVAGPFVGRWADRAGRRRPYLIGVGMTAIASILGGVALGIFDLAAYRIISGIGTGMLTVAAMSYVSDITTTRNRATAMSIFSASTLAGAALGPFPGGYIAESFTPALTGYKATFFAGGLLKLLVGAYAFFMIREQRRPAARSAAKAGAPSGWGALANAAVLATCVSVFLFGIGFGAFLYFTVPVLGAQLGFTPSQGGWIVSGFGFGHVAGALAFGPLSDRMGRRALFGWTGILFSGIPIALFGLTMSLPVMVAITLFVGFISAPLCGVVPTLVAELVPESAGAAMGIQKSSEQLGIFVGPSLAGATIAALGVDAAVIGAGIVMVVGGLLFLFLVQEPSVRRERVTCGAPDPKGECCGERNP